MKMSKLLITILTALVLTGGSALYVNSSFANNAACEIAGSCGKCGDGYCNPRCGETSKNCPRDCGVVDSAK
jgi:hypothetical protein